MESPACFVLFGSQRQDEQRQSSQDTGKDVPKMKASFIMYKNLENLFGVLNPEIPKDVFAHVERDTYTPPRPKAPRKPESDIIELVAQRELEAVIRKALARLSPREEVVIRKRYGIGGNDYTFEEVGQLLGVTRERIRQIEKKAIKKLRLMKDLSEFLPDWKEQGHKVPENSAALEFLLTGKTMDKLVDGRRTIAVGELEEFLKTEISKWPERYRTNRDTIMNRLSSLIPWNLARGLGYEEFRPIRDSIVKHFCGDLK